MKEYKKKIDTLRLQNKILEPKSSLQLEKELRNQGVEISDNTIRRYRESIQSGIIEITPELRERIQLLTENNIKILEQTSLLFESNVKVLSSYDNFLLELKKNPEIIKLLNTIYNQLDKLIRLNQLLNPSKAIDIELMRKQNKRIIRFDNIE